MANAATVTAMTDAFRLSIKHDGIRQSAGDETLTYSSLWDGGDGATVTIAQDGAALAEGLTGEGERAWSVRKTGSYTLSHTTYTNGVAGKVETATFVVPGPELSFEYDGGLFVGGTLTINGGIDGWTIYYTLDGSIPTTESTEYSGPFTLSAAATVKAFAVSGNGLVTDVFGQEYAVVEHARIENVRARQRWPWNGKVDIDFDVFGDVTLEVPEGADIALVVTATNRVVGTNYVASMSALSGDTGTAAGAHRVTWDLNAQELNFKSDDVVFTVAYSVEKSEPYCVIDLSGGASAASYPVSYLADVPSGGWTDEYKTTKLVLRKIEPGTFMLCDLISTTISQPFYIGVFEVTQKQYSLVAGSNPSSCKGDMRPVDRATYNAIRGSSDGAGWPESSFVDGTSFLGKLRAKTGVDTFDLPTEAQWEYACRAGTTSAYNNGGSTVNDLRTLGRYGGNRSEGRGGYSQHTIVGSYEPNAWGLYDMHGNVWEWCLDWYGILDGGTDPKGATSGSARVVRSGGWTSAAEDCMSSFRFCYQTYYDSEYGTLGFRLCCPSPVGGSGQNVTMDPSDVVCFGVSADVKIDSGATTRDSLGDETLIYSSQWDGGDGATVTIAQDGTALVEGLTGEGERAWSVTKTGTYTLSHTTYTNGVAGKVETAIFVVPGPELTFEYDGGAFIGGTLTINGNIDGWTIYYTLDGSMPTTESTEYTGPFTLSAAATVKAFAVSGTGMETEVVGQEYVIIPRHQHDGIIFDKVLDASYRGGPLPAGNYYLDADLDVTNSVAFTSGTVNLCLNGHVIDAKGREISVVTVGEGVTFNLYDEGTVRHYFTADESGMWVLDDTKTESELFVDGGVITGGRGTVLSGGHTWGGGILSRGLNRRITLHCGNIVGNLAEEGGGVYVGYGDVRIEGGNIVGNYAIHYGGGISVYLRYDTQKFQISGGVISSNVVERFYGSGVYVLGDDCDNPTIEFEIAGGDIFGNRVLNLGGGTEACGGGLYMAGSICRMSGGRIAGNSAQSGGAIYCMGGEIVMSGGVVSNNMSFSSNGFMGLGGGLYVNQSSLSICGGSICDNTDDNGVASIFFRPIAKDVSFTLSGDPEIEGTILLQGTSQQLLNPVIEMADDFTGLGVYVVSCYPLPTAGNPIAITDANAQDYSSFFTSADDAYMVKNSGSGDAQVVQLVVAGVSKPTISSVVGATYTYGATPGTVRVTASGDAGSALSYQWYTSTSSYSAQNLVVVAGATSATYTMPDGLTVGDYYYVCEVTATNPDSGRTACATSGVAKVTVTKASYDMTSAAWDYVEPFIYDATEKKVSVTGLPTGVSVSGYTGNVATNAGTRTAYATLSYDADNYNAPYISGVSWRIDPRSIVGASVVLDDSMTYNGSSQQQTVSSVIIDDLPVTYSVSGNTGIAAGDYQLTITGTGNFMGSVTVPWSIGKASAGGGGGDEPGDGEVPTGGESKFDVTAMYDGEGHIIDTNALAAAFGAAMIGESAVAYAVDDGSGGSGVRGAPALPWGAVPVYTNAGEYVVWYRVSNPNYEDFIHAAKVTITNRPVTVTVVGHTSTYDYDTTEKGVAGCEATTDDGLYDVAASTTCGGALGDRALPGGVVFDGVEAVRTDVGTTPMGLVAADFANNDANFLVTYLVTDGWVKVEPRVIGDDPANWDIRLARNPMYDGTEQTVPITQVAFVKPDGNLDNIPYTLSGNTATDAGNYVVRITGTGNYSGTVEKEWAITPRNVALTSGSAEWVYDGTAHSETAISVTGDGFADGEGASYSGFPVVRHVSDAATPTANTFTYALNANTKAGNYSITMANGTVKMNPRAITLTAPTKSRQYDGTALTFTAAEVTATLTGGGQGLPALPDGEAFTLGNFASIIEAGRVDATFTIADGTALMNDYAITTVAGTLTVTRNATEITVTAKSGSWTYNGQPHSLHEYEATNLGVLQAGDALDVAFSDESVVLTPIDGPEGNGVVANVITGVRVMRNGTDDVTANYTLAPYAGTLTVTRRPVTLTSKSDTKAYDGTPLTAHEATVGGDGFVGEDGANYAFTGSQTEKGTSKNAFTYNLKSGTSAAYYDITKVEGDLTVTAADISAGTDQDWEIVLGPALAYTGLEQIQTFASVTYKGLPLDYSVTGNAQTDAGNYTMTLTGQGNFSGTHQVAWSISPKALTLTAESGSRVYDGTAFTVGTVTASGFVANEGATCQCTGSQTDVGSSPNEVGTIGWNANTKGSNYAVTKVAGTLTVTPRPVTLTAANISKPYDGTPLALTAADITASGLVAGESFTYSDFASRTEAGQTPATFSYAAGPGTSLANYSVTVTAGRTITITKSATAISVTAASESWVYDGEAHSNRTWTATNLDTLQSGDVLEVTFDDASIATTPQDGPAHDGVVANVITGVRVLRSSGGPQSLAAEDVTANYSVEWFPGTLAVTKRPVTVTVTGHTATYTYDGEEKSVTGYDTTTADALYDIAADTVFGGVATTNRTDAGKSDMGLTAADFTNNDDCFDVTYAVTDGWVKINPLDIVAAGDEFAIVLGANPKYNGTVQTIAIDSVTCGGLPVTYTLAGENATHAGIYTLTVKANGNFTGERSTTWQILKRAVTLTSGSASKVYDGTALVNPNVSITGDGFIGLEGATFDVTGRQTAAGTSKNTFTYTLKAGTQSGDYAITKVEGDLTVTKATYPGQEPGGAGIRWSVAADAATWMYDGQVHGVTLTGVPSGVTAHLSGDTATDAGEYTASVTLDYDAANYEPPVAPAPLAWSITRRPISLQTVNAEKPYDGFPLSVDVANITPGLSGYAAGECFDYYDLASITEVGEVAATFSYRDSATAKVANYAVTVVGGAVLKVTVGGDQISVTAKDGTWAYDGEAHRLAEWTIVNADKLLDGHAFQIKVSDASVITTPRDGDAGDGIVSNTFEYVRIVDTASGADKTRNYNLFVYDGKLQVTNACIGIEMLDGIERVEKVYDGAATGAVVTATLLQPATVRYWNDGEGAVATQEPPQFTDADEYTVWYEITADYYDAYTGRVDVAIAKRSVTLTSPTKAKPYDGMALTFGAGEITVGGDGYADGESFVFSNFAGIADAGRVDATFDYAAGANTDLANYEVSVVKGTLTVKASADEITVTAKSGSWPYDAQAHVLHECDVVNGDVLQHGDELVVEYDAASTVTTPDDGEVENRIVSVKVMRTGGSQSSATDVTANYSIAVYPGTIKVVNANVTFGAVDPATFSTAATYDGEGHTIAVTAPTLLTTPVTVAYSSTGAGPWKGNPMAVAVTNAGTHTIRYRISAQYYNDYFGEATVTISPRTVTLLSASAAKVYDGTPLRKDEVSVKEGSLGFVDGEGVDATCNNAQTGVGKIENGFTYEFRSGTLSDNYTIIPEFGWLEVTPGTLSVNVEQSSYAGVYDGSPHGVTPVFSGTGLNPNACEVTYALVDGDESAYAAEAPTFADVGMYTVYVKIKAQNFIVAYTAMTVTITARPVTVNVTGQTGTFTYDKTEKTVSGYEATTTDALYNIAADTTFGGVAVVKRTAVGTTQMGIAAADFTNGNANFFVTYLVTDGWITINKAGFDPKEVFGEEYGDNPLLCEKTYNGSQQPVEVVPNFDEPYEILWSLDDVAAAPSPSLVSTPPTLRNVADGELLVYFKFVTDNYEPCYGSVMFRIVPKTLTDEMVVLSDEAFYYDPGSTVKKPAVTVADTNAVGEVISTENDYTIAYEEATAAGAIPVTVTAKNNYIGTVTKTFPVLKRPVAPPVIGAKSYTGKKQTASIPDDDRWIVVQNDGGIDSGEYPVVLRLTNPDDYKWKGFGDDEAEWTGVFVIRQGANGWSRNPGIASWTNGETPSEPVMGTPRRGTTSYVTYRRRGADVETATRERPSRPGQYTARFVVEETANYAGTYMDVDFEIYRGAGDTQTETETTPVPVPYVWLDPYLAKYGAGDYEAAGKAKGRNGRFLWESYVAGLNPEEPTSQFTAMIEMQSDGTPKVTWSPDLSKDAVPRTYTTLGKATLLDATWTPVTEANKAQMRFFKVTVEIK